MKSHHLIGAGLIAVACMVATPVRAQEVSTETVEGITNFHRIETTVACAGATKVQAVPEIKKMGFASIINLRQDSEPGADVEAEAAAAKAVDIRYWHIPFNGAAPDPPSVDNFMDGCLRSGMQ